MYTFYTDKTKDFKFNLDIEGASLDSTQVRLVLENPIAHLLFPGTINSEGSCIVPIKKLKGVLNEGATGTLKLEVIADDTYFSPWEDSFEVKTSKKVTVEVVEKPHKPSIREDKSIKVNIQTPAKKETKLQEEKLTHSTILAEILTKKGINLDNIKENIDNVTPIISRYVQRFKLTKSSEKLLEEIINKLN